MKQEAGDQAKRTVGRNFHINLRKSLPKNSGKQYQQDKILNEEGLQTWEKLGKLFHPEEEECQVALSLPELKNILLKLGNTRRKSPDTVARKIQERFGLDSSHEIFSIDARTGQVQVTLENGKQDLKNLQFVYPKDYYLKKTQDYAKRQEKRKPKNMDKKKIDDDSQKMQHDEQNLSEEREDLIQKIENQKHPQYKVVFKAPYGQFSNSQIINNINQTSPQQEFPNINSKILHLVPEKNINQILNGKEQQDNHKRGSMTQQENYQQEQKQQSPITPEEQIEGDNDQYPICQQLLNLNTSRQLILGNTENQKGQQQDTHLELSTITKQIKKHKQNHGEKARQKSKGGKNTKNEQQQQRLQQKLDRQKQQKIAKSKQKQQQNSLKIISPDNQNVALPTWRQLSLEDSRIQQKRQ